MSLTIAGSVKSPSLNEQGDAVLTDPSGNQIPLVIHVHPDSVTGANELAGLTVIPGQVSQVTGRPGRPMVAVGGVNVPVMAVMNVGAGPALSKSGGKFQSSVQTGSGAAQNIAHGLGVVPTLVLVSIYNTNGVAAPYAISEGTHTATNVVVTVTNNVQYKVIAFV